MDTRDDECLDGGVRAREKAKRPQRSLPPKGLRHFLSSPTLTFPMPASRRWWNSSLPPPPPLWQFLHCPGQKVGAVGRQVPGEGGRAVLVGNREYVIETLPRGAVELPRQDHTRAKAPCHSPTAPFSYWRKHTSPAKHKSKVELLRISRRQLQSIKLPEMGGCFWAQRPVSRVSTPSFRTHKALLPHQGTGQQEALWKLQCPHRCPPGESQHVDTCPRCHQQRVSGSQGNSTCQPGRSPPTYSEKWEGFAVFAERLRGGQGHNETLFPQLETELICAGGRGGGLWITLTVTF